MASRDLGPAVTPAAPSPSGQRRWSLLKNGGSLHKGDLPSVTAGGLLTGIYAHSMLRGHFSALLASPTLVFEAANSWQKGLLGEGGFLAGSWLFFSVTDSVSKLRFLNPITQAARVTEKHVPGSRPKTRSYKQGVAPPHPHPWVQAGSWDRFLILKGPPTPHRAPPPTWTSSNQDSILPGPSCGHPVHMLLLQPRRNSPPALLQSALPLTFPRARTVTMGVSPSFCRAHPTFTEQLRGSQLGWMGKDGPRWLPVNSEAKGKDREVRAVARTNL